MQESTAEFVVSQMYFKEQWTSDPIDLADTTTSAH